PRHRPALAADPFSYRARLGATINLLTSLRAVVNRHAKGMPASTRPDPVALGQTITEGTDKLALVQSHWTEAQWVSADKPVHRFAQGRIPKALIPECEQLSTIVGSICAVVASIADALMETDESKSPAERDEQT